MKVIIRADASCDIGGGHIMRCLTLADILADHGWQCTFATRSGSMETVPALQNSRHKTFTLRRGVQDEVCEIKEFIGNCDWLIVDHYRLNASFEREARSFANNIFVIDDLADRAHDCDILLDQTYGRKIQDYEGLVPTEARLLIGADYALLRPQFLHLRSKAQDKRSQKLPLQRVLISMGASDPHGVIAKILHTIQSCELDVAVDIAVGSSDPARIGLSDIAEQMPQQVYFHSFKSNMAELMLKADLAIGAGGSTSWERCCLGLPTLMIVTADNQKKIAKELEQVEAVKYLGPIENFDDQRLGDALQSFNNNPGSLRKMADISFRICNGKGALKAYIEIAAFNRKSDSIRIRPTIPNDSEDIFNWQQIPETRALFRNPQIPTRQEHNAWFANKLDDPNCIALSIIDGEQLAGIIRLDKNCQNEEYEVSITIAPDMHGKGIGKKALSLCTQLYTQFPLTAEIHPKNIASRTIFMNSGFKEVRNNYFTRLADA